MKLLPDGCAGIIVTLEWLLAAPPRLRARFICLFNAALCPSASVGGDDMLELQRSGRLEDMLKGQ